MQSAQSVRYPAVCSSAREKGYPKASKHVRRAASRRDKLIKEDGVALPVRVKCGTWVDDKPVKLAAVAVKLWNEAKREGKARARPK